ncbi:MAG TPA: STAS domain-containing protein [Solirubrobacterales bacterium]|nr:STAS domain-containing protein [Solirubrobacterales bacterium]
MCTPRYPSRQIGRDVSQFLPPLIELSESGNLYPVLRCRGELDGANAPRLGALLDSACEREIEGLLLDLGEVEFVDAPVLALVAATRARLEACGASLRIRAAGQPLRLLRLTRIAAVDAEPAPRFDAWPDRSSSFSSPTITSAPTGAAATR